VKLNEKQLEVIARAALEYLDQEKQKQEKQKHDRRLRNVKLLLRNYRSFKLHCEDVKLDIKRLDKKLELDELDTNEFAIESIKRSKERTLAMVKFIDKMIAVFKVMCEQSGKEEDLRIYQSVYYLYISEDKKTAKEIATCQNTDPRTVYRDVKTACKTLSTLVFGVDSIRFY
jgi:hypothetical protein